MDENQDNGQQEQSGTQEAQEQAQGLGQPQEGQQGAEGGQEGQQEPPKPPERPKHWNREAQAIPLDRFNEVNNRAKSAEAELAAMRARMAELERSTAPQADPNDPEAIDPAKFTDAAGNFDGAAYMRERDRRVAAQAEKRALESVDKRLQERDAQRQQAEVVQRTEQGFRAQVAEASKANPQVAEAVEYLDSIAHHIPFPVQMAILRSAPEAAHAIAMDPTLVEQLVRGNPADSILLVGEINGRVKASRGGALQAPATLQGGIPQFQPGGAAQRPQAPAPRTLNGGGNESVSRLPNAEYIRRRERGEL